MRRGIYYVPSAWFGFIIFLMSATSLRLRQLPIGPGEILAVLWVAYGIFTLLVKQKLICNATLKPLLIYFILFPVLMLPGWIYALHEGRWDYVSGWHDALAYLFLSVLFGLFILRQTDLSQVKYSLLFFMIFGVLGSAILYVLASIDIFVSYERVWNVNHRYLGLTTNPNQLALLLSPIPFVAIYLAYKDSSMFLKFVYALIGLVSLFLGKITGSDALIVAWLSGLFVITVLWYINEIISGVYGYWRAVFLKLTIPSAVMIMLVVGVLELPFFLQRISEIYYAESSQGPVRIALWFNSLVAASESLMLGFGPGAYSGIEAPFQGMEAHNTFLDLLSVGGAFSLVAFVSLIAWAIWKVSLVKQPFLMGALVSLMMSSVFHHVGRQPVFWFLLMAIVCLSTRRLSFNFYLDKQYQSKMRQIKNMSI